MPKQSDQENRRGETTVVAAFVGMETTTEGKHPSAWSVWNLGPERQNIQHRRHGQSCD